MKTNVKNLLLIALMITPMLLSCTKDDPEPSSAVIQAFNEKYPNADSVEWETRGMFVNAEFTNNQFSTDAWFDMNGKWQMTKTELRSINQLPEPVLTAFKNSEYADWFVDDIDRIERNEGEVLYIIEVKKDKKEFDLYFSADGVLIKAQMEQDDDDYYNEFVSKPTIGSNNINSVVLAKYPTCRIIEVDIEHGLVEVDIIHENRGKEVVLALDGTWVNTHYDVRKTEVSAIVMEALNNSAYSDYYIDDVEYYETPTGNFFLFELEKGHLEIDLKIDESGNIIAN